MNDSRLFLAFICFLIPAAILNDPIDAQEKRPGSSLIPPVASGPQIDEELSQILDNWEKAGQFTQKLEGKHVRYIYDHIFNVEKWSEGKFYYESPDRGRIDLDPPSNFAEGNKRVRNGKTYEIKQDKSERWVCDGTQVIAIDEERKEYQRLPIPKENQGVNIVDGPLPFLFGISKEKVLMRYQVQKHDDPAQGGQHNLQQGKIHLKVKPLWQQDAANWQTAEVMLNARSYLPMAIKLIHPGGNAETVYVFQDVKRNAESGFISRFFKDQDPFAPNLRGYKELTATSTVNK